MYNPRALEMTHFLLEQPRENSELEENKSQDSHIAKAIFNKIVTVKALDEFND